MNTIVSVSEASQTSTTHRSTNPPVIFSFDIEEHYRIEAANGVTVSSHSRADYQRRMQHQTEELLEQLAQEKVAATFYIVAEIAKESPDLIQKIVQAGHEIGSHSLKHWRIHDHTPQSLLEDLRTSREILEQASGQSVSGFRAPTFSVTRQTAWAVEVLIEAGFTYDTSIFPVRHDRYGVIDAPRTPFRLQSQSGSILELPMLTYRRFGQNLPVAGGGYFRLFPQFLMRAGIRQIHTLPHGIGMLYFHPWEFDAEQPKLPLKRLSRWRTYVGIRDSKRKLSNLLQRYQKQTCRAVDVAEELNKNPSQLPTFALVHE